MPEEKNIEKKNEQKENRAQSSELRAQSVKPKRASKNKSPNQADYVGSWPNNQDRKKRKTEIHETKKFRKPKRTKKGTTNLSVSSFLCAAGQTRTNKTNKRKQNCVSYWLWPATTKSDELEINPAYLVFLGGAGPPPSP
jgi:hypothetical protein